jgi:hypothetical protein
MIHEYVIKLIDNLPDDVKNVPEPVVIDLVLDGGVFNGSYLVGALYFLKEMEKRKYIKVDRISGCSIGSLVAFLYFIDGLDLMSDLYEMVNKDFKRTYKLQIVKDLKIHLGKHIPIDICKKVNKKLFISYNNVLKKKKIVKSVYKNVDDIINSIIHSCFLPFLIDGSVLHKNKYIDGFNPYIFDTEKNKQILHLDLFGYDKIWYLLNVKNEKTNCHRVLSGLLDIHSFFIKKCGTPMCSYVNNWSILAVCFNKIKTLAERIIIYLVYYAIIFKNKCPNEFKESFFYKVFSKISYDIFIIILENYCL